MQCFKTKEEQKDLAWQLEHCSPLLLQMLCAKGAQTLETKSINVEDAVNELINMLLDAAIKEQEEEEEDLPLDTRDEEATEQQEAGGGY